MKFIKKIINYIVIPLILFIGVVKLLNYSSTNIFENVNLKSNMYIKQSDNSWSREWYHWCGTGGQPLVKEEMSFQNDSTIQIVRKSYYSQDLYFPIRYYFNLNQIKQDTVSYIFKNDSIYSIENNSLKRDFIAINNNFKMTKTYEM